MMQFMLLIYSNPEDRPKPGTPAFDALMQGYGQLGSDLRAAGVHVAGDALVGAQAARTLRGSGAAAQGPWSWTAPSPRRANILAAIM
jgi:hypothetical protein